MISNPNHVHSYLPHGFLSSYVHFIHYQSEYSCIFLLSGSDTGVQFIVILTSPAEGLFQLMTTNHDHHFLVSLVSWEMSDESTSFYIRALENKSDEIRQQMKSYIEVTKHPTCSQMIVLCGHLDFAMRVAK